MSALFGADGAPVPQAAGRLNALAFAAIHDDVKIMAHTLSVAVPAIAAALLGVLALEIPTGDAMIAVPADSPLCTVIEACAAREDLDPGDWISYKILEHSQQSPKFIDEAIRKLHVLGARAVTILVDDDGLGGACVVTQVAGLAARGDSVHTALLRYIRLLDAMGPVASEAAVENTIATTVAAVAAATAATDGFTYAPAATATEGTMSVTLGERVEIVDGDGPF